MNKKILLLAFAISGFTALVYEIAWSRSLEIIFGSTIYAVSTILTTFFVGFALGSYLFRNLADSSKNPGRIFALLQICIGLYGILIIGLFRIITSLYLALGMPILQFLLLFLILIIPTILFGATWPIMNAAYIDKKNIGKDSGKLYSLNSLGAFLGPLAAGFILIPILGITKTSLFAVILNLVLGILMISKGGKNGA